MGYSMKAFLAPEGVVLFGSSLPPGALLLCSGHAKSVRDAVRSVARQPANAQTFILVPGFHEAKTITEANAALITFAIACTKHIEQRKAKGVRHGA